MKPLCPEELARLLDQVQRHYPHGVPTEAIRSSAHEDRSPRYHFIVVTDNGGVPAVEMDLLRAIASKGLKVSEQEYTVSYAREGAWNGEINESTASNVVVFGSSHATGRLERPGGGAILFGAALATIASDATAKRELWKGLQELL